LLTLLRTDALKGLRTDKALLKVVFCLSALMIGTVIDIILWIGVTTTPGPLHEDVLATIAVALGLILAATFTEACVLVADAFSFGKIRLWLVPATVVFQRTVALVGAGVVVVVVSDTREDLQPGVPAWHLLVRTAYVMVPLVVGRWCAISWRRARAGKGASTSSDLYERIRKYYWLPFAAVGLTAFAALVYSTALWTQLPTTSPKHWSELYGHVAVMGILLGVGVNLALLELAPSADTMEKLWPWSLRLVNHHRSALMSACPYCGSPTAPTEAASQPRIHWPATDHRRTTVMGSHGRHVASQRRREDDKEKRPD
jgi:hypothetical protein